MNRNRTSKNSKPRTLGNGMESLESRQMMTAIVDTAVVTLDQGDGTKNNGNDVVLKFDGNIGSVDFTKFRLFGYAINTLSNTGAQIKKTINVLSASKSGKNVTLRTDVQVRKGANVTLNAGAVTDSNGVGVTGTTNLAKGLNKERFTLALRAFRPSDPTLFSSTNLTGGSVETTANTEPSASSVRTALGAFLDKKVAAGTISTARRTATMTRFDASATAAKVPSANIRAAILSLVGTVGEPAIGYYLDAGNTTGKDFASIGIDGTTFSGALPVVETKYNNSGKLRLTLNPNYAGESFVVLSGRMAHESVHEGTDLNQIDSQEEEVIANFIETTVYAQQVVTDPAYAQQHTTLTGKANYRLLALINSGDRQFPRVGVLQAPLLNQTAGALPGFTAIVDSSPSSKIKSFEDDVREEFIDRNVGAKDPTPSYPTGRAILANITGETYTSATKYGVPLIKDVDITQDTMSDRFVMSVAHVLKVNI